MDVVKLPKKVRMVCYEIMDGKEEALATLESSYITSYNNARSLIRRLERDEILEEFVRFYITEHER